MVRRLWTVPARVPEFIGRNDILNALDTAAHADRRAVVCAITGMGGAGKTAIAIEYAHRHRAAFDIAWWIPAEDPTLVPARLAELAHGLSLASPTDPVGVALGRLRAALAERGRWLLVFDNAEDPSALAEYLPDGSGNILITSRNPGWRGTQPVAVGEFARAESISLLRALAPALTGSDADRIAAALGDLPLAVEQAGAQLADAQLNTDTYLQLLSDRADELLDQDHDIAYPASVTASWEVGFDRLATDNPTALDLLTAVAWCAPDAVPLSLFTEHPDVLPDGLRQAAADPLAFSRCTRLLHRRGMAAVSPHALQVHRVPAALLRARTRDATRGETIGRALCCAYWWPRCPEILSIALRCGPPGKYSYPTYFPPSPLTVYLTKRGTTRDGYCGMLLSTYTRGASRTPLFLISATPTPSTRPNSVTTISTRSQRAATWRSICPLSAIIRRHTPLRKTTSPVADGC